MKKLFKVVSYCGRSVVAFGDCNLLYQVGVKTTPPVGKLFCFGSLVMAREFRINDELILEGEGTVSADQRLPLRDGKLGYKERWEQRTPHSPSSAGTVLCDDFTPERVVPDEESI